VDKARPTHRADNSAVQIAPNVKVRMEAQHSIPPLSLQDLLPESFTFTYGSWNGDFFPYTPLADSFS
jgi:hypothetical protein